jgi:hypothetical protein
MPEDALSIAAISQGHGNLYGPGQVWLQMKGWGWVQGLGWGLEAHRSGVFVMGWQSQWRLEVRSLVLPTGVETHRLTFVYCQVEEHILCKAALQNCCQALQAFI